MTTENDNKYNRKEEKNSSLTDELKSITFRQIAELPDDEMMAVFSTIDFSRIRINPDGSIYQPITMPQRKPEESYNSDNTDAGDE